MNNGTSMFIFGGLTHGFHIMLSPLGNVQEVISVTCLVIVLRLPLRTCQTEGAISSKGIHILKNDVTHAY